MGRLTGRVRISNLPPHRGMTIELCFFRVDHPSAPVPYDGDPPVESIVDCHAVVEQTNLQSESDGGEFEHAFLFERDPGYYYVQVRVLLFRSGEGKMFAQAEQFFFGRRPLELMAGENGPVTLPVSWPSASLDELHHYGTVKPRP